ncbi:hypothetical protein [Pseudanabaena sp. 'Roaring Creek']|uniref:hypothetical protein n=1 Tax=Pseudanabaena sp. 'Roaring Creek' TaxID=1681830 RepID=UPI000A635A73|nr:hypothetical protein [Pseudanabaena sp. 'Roaring Creek']
MKQPGEDYDLLPGEASGIFRVSSFGPDPRPRHTSGPNRDYNSLELSILLNQAVEAKDSSLASSEVAGLIGNIPNVIEGFSQFAPSTEGLYEVRWDRRRIVPVPRSLLRNQTETPRWIVDIVFGAVLYFTQAKTPQGIYK